AKALGEGKRTHKLAPLSAFCELADAGIAAMNACWTAVGEGDGAGFPRTSDVLARPEVADAFDDLIEAGRRWQREASSDHRPDSAADALAAAIDGAAGNRKRQLVALERHHNRFGGGLRWLAIEGETVKPLAPLRGGD